MNQFLDIEAEKAEVGGGGGIMVKWKNTFFFF